METLNDKMKNCSVKGSQTKRSEYISWNDYFMAIAILASKRSKDPVSQVGACVVNDDNKIVGIGYNGMPLGCNDDAFPWGKNNPDAIQNKGLYVCHAEMNAIINKISADIKGCTMYVGLFPCNECSKIIIQSGIKTVIFLSDKYASKPSTVASKSMFDAAGIQYRKFQAEGESIVINFDEHQEF